MSSKTDGLDLSAEILDLDPMEIHTWHEVEQDKVDLIEQALRKTAPDWPTYMPKVVVGVAMYRGAPVYEIADGHHRLNAAIQAGLKSIPAIVVDGRTLLQLNRRHTLNGTMKAFSRGSKIMRDNQKLRVHSGEWIH